MPTIEADIKPRPEFSRFEMNLGKGAPLPIFPLTFPTTDAVGVMIVGDYIAQDLVRYLDYLQPGLRDKWIIISTTQSDAVPVDCKDVDFNFFTNQAEVSRYDTSPAGNVPYSTEMGDGHYVDPEVFYPNHEADKKWDIVYAAKWYPTKKTELLIEAAKLDPSLKVAIYGWPVISERKIQQSLAYRDYLIGLAENLSNVTIFDGATPESDVFHSNSDKSIVVGNLTKEQMRDKLYVHAKAGICLSETTEAVNRVCTEMLCCDIPILVAPTNGGLERLVNFQTGKLIPRTAEGILEGIRYINSNQDSFSPRSEFLSKYGKQKSNERLAATISSIAKQKGVVVNWDSYQLYGGDLWTSPEVYREVLSYRL